MTPNRKGHAYALSLVIATLEAQQIRHRRHRPQKPDQLPWDVVVTKNNLVRIVRLFRIIFSGRFAVIGLRAKAL